MVSQRAERSAHSERRSQFETIEQELQAFYSHTYGYTRASFIDNNFDEVVNDDGYHQLEHIAATIATGTAVEAVGGWVEHVVTRTLPGAAKTETLGPTCSVWTHQDRYLLVDWSGGKVTVLDTTGWPTAIAGGAR